MRKERNLSKDEKVMKIAIIASLVIFIVGYLVLKSILPISNIVIRFIVVAVILLLMFISCIIIITITTTLICCKVLDYMKQKSKNKVLRKLSNEFSEVKLKGFENSTVSNFISYEEIRCVAKLDENGKIIYQVYINAEDITDNYGLFLNTFEI